MGTKRYLTQVDDIEIGRWHDGDGKLYINIYFLRRKEIIHTIELFDKGINRLIEELKYLEAENK